MFAMQKQLLSFPVLVPLFLWVHLVGKYIYFSLNALHYFSNVMHYITHYLSKISNKQILSLNITAHLLQHMLFYEENGLPYVFLSPARLAGGRL